MFWKKKEQGPVDVSIGAVRYRLAQSKPWDKMSLDDRRDIFLVLADADKLREELAFKERLFQLLSEATMTLLAKPITAAVTGTEKSKRSATVAEAGAAAVPGTGRSYYQRHKRKMRSLARKYYKQRRARILGVSTRELKISKTGRYKYTR